MIEIDSISNQNLPEKQIQSLDEVRAYLRHLQQERNVLEHSIDTHLAGLDMSRMSEEETTTIIDRRVETIKALLAAETTITTYLSKLDPQNTPEYLKEGAKLIAFAQKRQKELKGLIQPF